MRNRLVIRYNDRASFTMSENPELQFTWPGRKDLKVLIDEATERQNDRIKMIENARENYLAGNPNPTCLHGEYIPPRVRLVTIRHRSYNRKSVESFRCTSRANAIRAFEKRGVDFIDSVVFYDGLGKIEKIYSAPIL